MQKEYQFITLRQCPQWAEPAAAWFSARWGIPQAAYLACMQAYVQGKTAYGWYLCLDGQEIVGGLGVIENDFHDRPDLAPNVCALYTQEPYRGQGIAGRLLEIVVCDLKRHGIAPLYLVTEHTGFYERYGWEFFCMVHDQTGAGAMRLYRHP